MFKIINHIFPNQPWRLPESQIFVRILHVIVHLRYSRIEIIPFTMTHTYCGTLKAGKNGMSKIRWHLEENQAYISWWRHQMETFSVFLAFCARNSPVTGEFPPQRPVTWSFDIFFDLRLKTNGWANNGDAGDLRGHRVHHDVIVTSLNYG